MTSQIRTHIEYLIQTHNILVLILNYWSTVDCLFCGHTGVIKITYFLTQLFSSWISGESMNKSNMFLLSVVCATPWFALVTDTVATLVQSPICIRDFARFLEFIIFEMVRFLNFSYNFS